MEPLARAIPESSRLNITRHWRDARTAARWSESKDRGFLLNIRVFGCATLLWGCATLLWGRMASCGGLLTRPRKKPVHGRMRILFCLFSIFSLNFILLGRTCRAIISSGIASRVLRMQRRCPAVGAGFSRDKGGAAELSDSGIRFVS
jgi:hypothetical protein